MTMKPPNTSLGSTVVQLAASRTWLHVLALVLGLIVVFVLLGAFWWGQRLRARQGPPPSPSEQPRKPDHPTHLEEDVTPSDQFPGGGERLFPHELGGHGKEAYRPPGDTGKPDEKRTGNDTPPEDGTPHR
jgi:uncharacterized protein DUF6479